MKKLVLSIAAVGVIATAVPASAQEFRLRAGPDGVTIRNDDDRWDRRRDRRVIERRVYRDEPRAYRRFRDVEECRIVTTRRERPNGTIVVRRQRVCD